MAIIVRGDEYLQLGYRGDATPERALLEYLAVPDTLRGDGRAQILPLVIRAEVELVTVVGHLYQLGRLHIYNPGRFAVGHLNPNCVYFRFEGNLLEVYRYTYSDTGGNVEVLNRTTARPFEAGNEALQSYLSTFNELQHAGQIL